MKILVTGSKYRPAVDVYNVLDRYLEASPEIITGDTPGGADASARTWAKNHAMNCRVFHSDNLDHITNFDKSILSWKPNLCLAFPLKSSIGTYKCITIARSAGIPVTIIPEFPNEANDRTVNDKVIDAIPTDGELMSITMDNVLARYEEGIQSLSEL